MAEAGIGFTMVVERRDDSGLRDLLVQMEKNLSERIGHVEDNVNKRMDQYEAKMEQYVLKEVFSIEIKNIRDELDDERKKREQAKIEVAQKTTWKIMVASVIVAVIAIAAGILF